MTTAITIDAAHSMDLDDAVWVERDGVGWAVTVVIANVCKEIHKGDPLDEKAHHQIATRYFATGSAPMLPRRLAEDSLSLLPGQPRQGMVIHIKLDGNLQAVGLPSIVCEPFTSAQRLAYVDVPVILADEKHPLHKTMLGMARLAEGLMNRRREAGALAMYDLNKGWFTTEDGTLRQLGDTRETIGHIIVQELMVLSNGELAKYAAHHNIPVLYRNHTAKPHAPNRMEVVSQLEIALRHPVGGIDVLRQRMNMTMNKADYGAVLLGHYGLNLPAYLHATSPIRRYADLVNQRQFVRHSKGKTLTYTQDEMAVIATHINAKIAADLDNTTDFYKERAVQTASRALERGEVDTLDSTHFERLVKTLVRHGIENPDDMKVFGQAVTRRLTNGSISLLDLYFLLLENKHEDSSWLNIRAACMAYLETNPSQAASVASVAMNLAGWSELKYDTKRAGPDHSPVFAVKASTTLKGGLLTKSKWVQAPSLKVAKQLAVVDLIKVVNGMSKVDSAVEEADPVLSPVQPAQPAFATGNTDPVAALQEYTQHWKLPLPEYTFSRAGGPDHAPLFTCTCTLRHKNHTSKALANKKEAKKEAARAVFQAFS